jgi:hypothetical protein
LDDAIVVGVPEISRFYGIVIGMFFREHGLPHFHAVHSSHKMSVEIESGRLHGQLSPNAQRLVLDWAALHKAELLENWERARKGWPLARIAPLE